MKFTDKRKRQWTIEFGCDSVVLLDRELGLRSLDFNGCFWPAINDDARTIDILWSLCREQAERRNVDMMDFLKAIDQATLDSARDALFREYIRFFRNPSKRDLLDRLRRTAIEIREMVEKRVAEALSSIPMRSGGDTPSSAQGSSGCVQAGSPCVT